jgi:DNA-binding response OmpR family regulator
MTVAAPDPPRARSILLAEHEPEVAEMSARYLRRDGLHVRLVSTPEQALAELTGGPDAAAVLDLTMPGLDPRRIRRALRTPVIFLVAGPRGPRPRGLARGGTGPRRWLARPFGPRQLVAMVRDVLAESASRPAGDAGEATERSGSALRLDGPGRGVLVDGQPMRLTATEFAVLAALLDQPGRVLSRRQLLSAAGRAAAGDRAADVYIAQLRAKLDGVSGGPRGGRPPGASRAAVIRTVRGAGYAIGGSVTADPGGRATIGGATVPM